MQKMIDDPDRRILRELQRDSSRTVTEIAEAVGLSHAPCWRRIQRLRSEGIILGEAAIVDRSKLGFDLEFFIYLKFSMEGRANVPEFRRKAVFGFSPRRDRLEVRLQLPADADLLPSAGISLLEGEHLCGQEGGWKCRWAEEGESGNTYWLEHV